jgi:hypothetical protein
MRIAMICPAVLDRGRHPRKLSRVSSIGLPRHKKPEAQALCRALELATCAFWPQACRNWRTQSSQAVQRTGVAHVPTLFLLPTSLTRPTLNRQSPIPVRGAGRSGKATSRSLFSRTSRPRKPRSANRVAQIASEQRCHPGAASEKK